MRTRMTVIGMVLACCAVGAYGQRAIVAPFDDGPTLLDEGSPGAGGILRGVGPGLAAGADHIIDYQCSNGGWGWPHTACPTTTYNNITGPIGLGLLHAYGYTGDPDHLAAAVAGGDYDLTSVYTGACDPNKARFGTAAPYFLWQLSIAIGDSTYSDWAKTEFFDALAAGTYGCNSNVDTAAWIAAVQAGRAGTWINLRPWEFETLGVTAAAIGNAGQQALFDQAILDGLNTLNNTAPATVYSDLLGLAGGVRGLALTGTTTFAAINSPNHSGINGIATLQDLADKLASYQNADGSWNWHSDLSSLGGATESDKDTQTTAYAVLALLDADPLVASDYSANIAAARDWLRSMQLPNGGFLSYPGGSENTEVEGEALNALAPDACAADVLEFLLASGSDCVQPGETVTVELRQRDLGQLVRGFQAFAQFDSSALTHIGPGNAFTTTPYALNILDVVSGDDIDLAAGIDDFSGQPATMADALLVTLQFTAGTTEGDTYLSFRAHDPPTRFSDAAGLEVLPCLIESPPITIDGTDPVIDCPAGVTIECDESSDPSNTGSATATDNLDPAPAITFSDVTTTGACPQESVITRTWTATDCAGNVTTCDQTITVVDTTAPVIACPADLTIECDESALPGNTGLATATDNCDSSPTVTSADVDTPGACAQEKTITRTWTATDDCGNFSTCVQTITVEDTTAPAFEFVPPDATVECDDSLVPSGLYGIAVGGVAVYYNSTGGENPANQAFLKAQIDGTNDPLGGVSGAPFVFSNAPLIGGNPFSWQALYSGLPWPVSQFGLDFVLPALTNDGSVPTPGLAAYENGNNNVSGRIPAGNVTWAINNYQPHSPDISGGSVINSIVRSQSPGVPAVDVEITQLDLTQVGSVFTIDIAGKLVSDGIHHWYTIGQPDSPMSNFGLNGDFYFSGTLTYDSTGDPGTDLIDFYSGTIMVYANSPTTQIEFARATDNCDPFPLVTYSDDLSGLTGCDGTGTILRTWTATDACGNSTSVVQTITVVDTTAPVLSDCPDDITVKADAGGCDAVVTYTPPTATDNCDGAPLVTCDWPSGSTFPVGATAVTCTAVDACGNASTCGFNVTVDDVSEVVVTVQLSPNIDTGNALPDTLTRCITFEAWDCAGPSSTTLTAEVDFTVAAGSPNTAIGTAVIDVPCNSTCLTARDTLHTLRRTANLVDAGTQYTADFTGDASSGGDWLIGGNLNDDRYIDILDFGVFSSQWAANYGSGDTTCSTAFPHADISGDGTVDSNEFSFIQVNFLKSHEANCCGQPGLLAPDAGPVTEISVRELRRMGLASLAAGDLNGDGVLNADDLAAFADGARPRRVISAPIQRLEDRPIEDIQP